MQTRRLPWCLKRSIRGQTPRLRRALRSAAFPKGLRKERRTKAARRGLQRIACGRQSDNHFVAGRVDGNVLCLWSKWKGAVGFDRRNCLSRHSRRRLGKEVDMENSVSESIVSQFGIVPAKRGDFAFSVKKGLIWGGEGELQIG
jgi:hypothetical protein